MKRKGGIVLRDGSPCFARFGEPNDGCKKFAKKAVDELERHPYMPPPASGGGLIEARRRFAPLLSRYNRSRNQTNRGKIRVGSLTLSV